LLLELIRRESLYKEELDVPASYFQDFQAKNPEIQLIGLKHINLKQASDQIRLNNLGKRECRNF
jgi:DNA polymerase-3 subunit alpha